MWHYSKSGWFGRVVIIALAQHKQSRTQLVLVLVTTFNGATISVFIQTNQDHSAWLSLHG